MRAALQNTKAALAACRWERLASLALGLQQESTSQATMRRASAKFQNATRDAKSLATTWRWARLAAILEDVSQNKNMMKGIRRDRANSVKQRESLEIWHRDR